MLMTINDPISHHKFNQIKMETSEISKNLEDEKFQDFVKTHKDIYETNNFMIQRSLDEGKLDESIHYCFESISMLQKPDLTPHVYNILYNFVSSSLIDFSTLIKDDSKFPTSAIAESYETVQYHEMTLQRLYMMIVIGMELANRNYIPTKDILLDILALLTQSQDPLRGLFLRHFFLLNIKNILPDKTHQEVQFSIEILLFNFSQMNRLWVRLEDTLKIDNKVKYRKEIADLIGFNIQRLSYLKNVEISHYTTTILPRIIKQVKICNDSLSQEYVLNAMIHVFPEDFLLSNVAEFFEVFNYTQKKVNVFSIISELLDRCINHVNLINDNSNALFTSIGKSLEEIFTNNEYYELNDKLTTLFKFVKFSLRINHDNPRNIHKMLQFSYYHVDSSVGEGVLESDSSEILINLIKQCIDGIKPIENIYELEFLQPLVDKLDSDSKISMLQYICNKMIDNKLRISTTQELKYVLSLTMSLFTSKIVYSEVYSLFYFIDGETTDDTFNMIESLVSSLAKLGSAVVDASIMPIGRVLLQLASKVNENKYILKFIHTYANECGSAKSFYLLVESAKMMDSLELKSFAEEYMFAALELFENIHDNEKDDAISYLINYVIDSDKINPDINTKICLLASKYGSINSLIDCASMFLKSNEETNDPELIQECLKRAAKTAMEKDNKNKTLEDLLNVLNSAIFYKKVGAQLSNDWMDKLRGTVLNFYNENVKEGQAPEEAFDAQALKLYNDTVTYFERELIHT